MVKLRELFLWPDLGTCACGLALRPGHLRNFLFIFWSLCQIENVVSSLQKRGSPWVPSSLVVANANYFLPAPTIRFKILKVVVSLESPD